MIALSERYSLQLIHEYAPTENSEQEEAETFYNYLARMTERESTIRDNFGDLNAKVERKEQRDTHYIDHFGLGAEMRDKRCYIATSTTKTYFTSTPSSKNRSSVNGPGSAQIKQPKMK